jgi:hypothetical protein
MIGCPSSRGAAGAGIGLVAANSGACSGEIALVVVMLEEGSSEGVEEVLRAGVVITASFSAAGYMSSKPPAVATITTMASCAMGDRSDVGGAMRTLALGV